MKGNIKMYLVVLENRKGELEMWNAKAFQDNDKAIIYAMKMNKTINHREGTYITFKFKVED